MKSIKLYKIAQGSWPETIGDGTLFYTEDCSRWARNVGGSFIDNPPRLSKDCAGLVWRYYQDTDRYLLVHVQGSQVVNAGLGRVYSFRAGYEVSRDDMNAISFNIPAVLKVVPRIATMKGGRMPLETEVDAGTSWPTGGEELKENILNAFYGGKRLFISLDVPDRRYHEDGIFKAQELAALLGAIKGMPKDVQRYMSFALCVDNNYNAVLEDVLVVVYLKDRMKVPENVIDVTWEKANTGKIVPRAEPFAFTLPGGDAPLMPFSQIQESVVVSHKKTAELQGEEWTTWKRIGHKLSEIVTNDWETFASYYGRMDETTSREYIETVKAKSVNWNLTGLSEELYKLMGYDDEQRSLLQHKTDVLKSVLLGDKTYSFLFPKGKLPKDISSSLNAEFIRDINLTSKDEVETWYGIFQDNDRVDDIPVKKAFASLVVAYVIPSLTSLEEVMDCMQKYPFVPASSYGKPKNTPLPSSQKFAQLTPEQKEKVNEWIKEEAEAYQFESVNDIIESLGKTKKQKTMESEALERLTKEKVAHLLTKSENRVFSCENLLDAIVKGAWKDKPDGVLLSAVLEVLYDEPGNGLSEETLLDASNWAEICKKYKAFPHVFFLVKNRFASFVEKRLLSPKDGETKAVEMAEKVKSLFVLSNENRNESNPVSSTSIQTHSQNIGILPNVNDNPIWNDEKEEKKNNVAKKPKRNKITVSLRRIWKKVFGKTRSKSSPIENTIIHQYANEAYDAYPLIKTFIKAMKKMNNNNADNAKTAEELETLFNGLKTVKGKKMPWYRKHVNLGLGFLLGMIAGALVLWLVKDIIWEPSTSGDEPVPVIEKRHPMLQLADSLDTYGQEKTINDFALGEQEYDVRLDSIASLTPISEKYVEITPNMESVVAHISFIDRENKKDSVIVIINRDSTLLAALAAVNQKELRVARIIIGSDTVAIPNDRLAPDTIANDSNLNVRYYFKVIEHIDSCLSKEESLRIAY